MELIGTIVRLQVQQASLKVGQRPERRYDPAPLRSVAALTLAEAGVTGWTEQGERVSDVHHRDHPASKNRDVNGISIGFTSHYAAMRERFGDHLVDGIAGENILVETDQRFEPERLGGELLIATAGGERVRLVEIVVAEPCVEFSRYALRHPDDAPSDPSVAEAHAFLRRGMRGYYATLRGGPVDIRIGDRVFAQVARDDRLFASAVSLP